MGKQHGRRFAGGRRYVKQQQQQRFLAERHPEPAPLRGGRTIEELAVPGDGASLAQSAALRVQFARHTGQHPRRHSDHNAGRGNSAGLHRGATPAQEGEQPLPPARLRQLHLPDDFPTITSTRLAVDVRLNPPTGNNLFLY